MRNALRRAFAVFSFAASSFILFNSSIANADDSPPPPVTPAEPPKAESVAPVAVSQCPADWKKRAYLGARDSIVRVDPIGLSIDSFVGLGGFVYPSRSHVVVLSSGIGVGRGMLVTFANNETRHARAVAVDETNDLAILALDREAPVPVLDVSDVALQVGDEVATVSAFEGTSVKDPDDTVLDAFLSIGHVANVGDRSRLRIDAATGYFPHGAPVLGCDGKVVAMRAWDELLPAAKIRALMPAPTAGAEPRWIDDKRWSFFHLNAGLLVQADSTRAWVGGSVGGAAVYADRLQVRLAFGGTVGIPSERERLGDDRREVGRLQLEPTIGYRVLLSEKTPLYLVPQVGMVGRMNLESRSVVTYSTSASCVNTAAGPCPVDQNVSRKGTSVSWNAAPAVGLTFLGVIGAVGYQWQMDVNDPKRSTHQVFVGLEF